MNIKYNILLWTMLLIFGSCSKSDISINENDGTDTEGTENITRNEKREIQLVLDNKLNTKPDVTRANTGPIASDSENQIVSMDIYMFGSEQEDGDYTFLEHLAYRSNQSSVEGATPFDLIPNADNTAVSTAVLNVTKGLYVKLYCVTNQPDLFMLPAVKNTYPDAIFTKLQLDAKGETTKITTKGVPTEKDFQDKYLLRVLTRQAAILDFPLPMVGNVAGPIDLTNMSETARLQTNLKLTRAVARFDIENNSEKSGLLINSIGMEEGNATTTMFPMKPQTAPNGKKIKYPEREFDDKDIINTGGRKSAYYSYAASKEACLLLKGKYKTVNGEFINVTYKVPFNNIKDKEGVEVAVQPNHRYTIKINEADPYEVKLEITIADWEEGENLDDFDPTKANDVVMTSISLSGNINNDAKLRLHTIDTSSSTTRGSITFQSNSDIKVSISYAGGDTGHKWLSFDQPSVTNLTSGNYSKQYTFTARVTVNNDKVYPPATVSFMNTAGSLKVITLHSYYLFSSNGSNKYVYKLDNGSKKYLIVKTDLDDSTTPWNTAMTKCPEKDGWRLPSMNDMRHLLKMENWDKTPYLTPGTKDYLDAFQNKTYTYNSSPGPMQFGYNSALTSSYYFYYDYYYWTTDVDPTNKDQAGYIRSYSSGSNVYFGFTSKSSSYRVRCIKDWN